MDGWNGSITYAKLLQAYLCSALPVNSSLCFELFPDSGRVGVLHSCAKGGGDDKGAST
jgi:hypothetical protein